MKYRILSWDELITKKENRVNINEAAINNIHGFQSYVRSMNEHAGKIIDGALFTGDKVKTYLYPDEPSYFFEKWMCKPLEKITKLNSLISDFVNFLKENKAYWIYRHEFEKFYPETKLFDYFKEHQPATYIPIKFIRYKTFNKSKYWKFMYDTWNEYVDSLKE